MDVHTDLSISCYSEDQWLPPTLASNNLDSYQQGPVPLHGFLRQAPQQSVLAGRAFDSTMSTVQKEAD